MSKEKQKRQKKSTIKHDLEQYQKNKMIIASHKAELSGDLMTTDVVCGSMAEFPYAVQVVTLHGVDEKRAQELYERIYVLSHQCERAEAFVAALEDEYMRSLLYWHYIKGLSWPKVRKAVVRDRQTTPDALRIRADRFLEKFL